jgi:hypothetical protein
MVARALVMLVIMLTSQCNVLPFMFAITSMESYLPLLPLPPLDSTYPCGDTAAGIMHSLIYILSNYIEMIY